MSTELQFRVLRLLESNPHLSQRELSKSLGVSLGGVNYCLQALMATGLIKIQNFRNNKNKWVYAYLLTPQGVAEKTALTGAFLKRKMQEYQELHAEIESLTHELAVRQQEMTASIHRSNESGKISQSGQGEQAIEVATYE